MKDISIEYAHIYTNNQISQEQELSIKVLSGIKQKLVTENQTFSMVVMVDDYSFPDPTFSYNSFNAWLKKQGYGPDLTFRESQLIPLCDQVIAEIENARLKNELTTYIKSKKYPCSLFIAAWYLLRLGHLRHDSFNQDLCAKKLINILPESFKPFEDKGLEIIGTTQFSGAVDQIEYQFILGRKI